MYLGFVIFGMYLFVVKNVYFILVEKYFYIIFRIILKLIDKLNL